ncbi:hypothetical protein ATANTOWER_000605 [Ataeniobius toweri]|uniref:Uncharacterized protein n=1 Tax=Ataeniobius toweri TaxID=208326 RepID=A0ABU7ACF1_9TELE|nr:hypothetical protein [Ataeniobius toweri]
MPTAQLQTAAEKPKKPMVREKSEYAFVCDEEGFKYSKCRRTYATTHKSGRAATRSRLTVITSPVPCHFTTVMPLPTPRASTMQSLLLLRVIISN